MTVYEKRIEDPKTQLENAIVAPNNNFKGSFIYGGVFANLEYDFQIQDKRENDGPWPGHIWKRTPTIFVTGTALLMRYDSNDNKLDLDAKFKTPELLINSQKKGIVGWMYAAKLNLKMDKKGNKSYSLKRTPLFGWDNGVLDYRSQIRKEAYEYKHLLTEDLMANVFNSLEQELEKIVEEILLGRIDTTVAHPLSSHKYLIFD